MNAKPDFPNQIMNAQDNTDIHAKDDTDIDAVNETDIDAEDDEDIDAEDDTDIGAEDDTDIDAEDDTDIDAEDANSKEVPFDSFRHIYQKNFQKTKLVYDKSRSLQELNLNDKLSDSITLAGLRDLYSTTMEEDFYFINPTTLTKIDESKEEYYKIEEVVKDKAIYVVVPDLIEITEAFTQGDLKVVVKLMPTPNPNNPDLKEHPPVMVRNVEAYQNVLLCQHSTNLAFEITSKGKYGFGTSISIEEGKGNVCHIIARELYYLGSSPEQEGTIEISCYQNDKLNISVEPIRNPKAPTVRQPLEVDDFIQKRCSKYPCRVVTWSVQQIATDTAKTVTELDVFQSKTPPKNLPQAKEPSTFSGGFGKGISQGSNSSISFKEVSFKEVEISQIDSDPNDLQQLDFFIVVGSYDEIKEITKQLQDKAKTSFVFPTIKLVGNQKNFSESLLDDLVPSAAICNNNILAAWKTLLSNNKKIQYAFSNMNEQWPTPEVLGDSNSDSLVTSPPNVALFNEKFSILHLQQAHLFLFSIIDKKFDKSNRKLIYTNKAKDCDALDLSTTPMTIALGSCSNSYTVIKSTQKDNNLSYICYSLNNLNNPAPSNVSGRLKGISSELTPCFAALGNQVCVAYTTPKPHQLKYAFFTFPDSGDVDVTPKDVEGVPASARCVQLFNFNKQLYMAWRKYNDPSWKMSFVKFQKTSNNGDSKITDHWVPAPEIQMPSFTRYRRGFIIPFNDSLYIV
jgi:hypothetical protein